MKSFFYVDGDGMKHVFDDSDDSTTAGSPSTTLDSLPSIQEMWDGADRDEDDIHAPRSLRSGRAWDEDSECDDESQVDREEDLPFVSEFPTRLEPSDARGLLWESSCSESLVTSL